MITTITNKAQRVIYFIGLGNISTMSKIIQQNIQEYFIIDLRFQIEHVLNALIYIFGKTVIPKELLSRRYYFKELIKASYTECSHY